MEAGKLGNTVLLALLMLLAQMQRPSVQTQDDSHSEICPVLQLKPWKLEGGDTALLDLIPLMEQIFRTNVPDVRVVVRSFEGQDIPSAFRERMLRLQQQKAAERRGLFGSLRR